LWNLIKSYKQKVNENKVTFLFYTILESILLIEDINEAVNDDEQEDSNNFDRTDKIERGSFKQFSLNSSIASLNAAIQKPPVMKKS